MMAFIETGTLLATCESMRASCARVEARYRQRRKVLTAAAVSFSGCWVGAVLADFPMVACAIFAVAAYMAWGTAYGEHKGVLAWRARGHGIRDVEDVVRPSHDAVAALLQKARSPAPEFRS